MPYDGGARAWCWLLNWGENWAFKKKTYYSCFRKNTEQVFVEFGGILKRENVDHEREFLPFCDASKQNIS